MNKTQFIIVFLLLLSQSNGLLAYEVISVRGNNIPNHEVTVVIDLLQICSFLSSNLPNTSVRVTDDQVYLTISTNRHSGPPYFPCDPLPPSEKHLSFINIGMIEPGNYHLNVLIVNDSKPPIEADGQLASFYQNVDFTVAQPLVIPTLSNVFLLLLMAFVLVFSYRSKFMNQ